MIQDIVRDQLTMKQRRQIALARVRLRQFTHPLRLLPDFLVIGAQRAGTSSLYRHFSVQPGIVKPLRKEIDYFSAHFDRPQAWYKAHFPVRRGDVRTFEATPQYLVHPLAPQRVAGMLPGIKLIVMLRHPVSRMRSQHAHMRGHNLEAKPLSEALESEENRIGSDLALIEQRRGHDPKELFRYGYLARSLYGEQLRRWLERFDRRALHIGSFEGLISQPEAELARIHDFLGLSRPSKGTLGNASSPTPPKDDSDLPDFVRRALREDEELLCDLLGERPPWGAIDGT